MVKTVQEKHATTKTLAIGKLWEQNAELAEELEALSRFQKLRELSLLRELLYQLDRVAQCEESERGFYLERIRAISYRLRGTRR